MRVAMTAHAGCGPAPFRFVERRRVDSRGIGGDGVVVTAGALSRREFLGVREVGRLRQVGVAVHAGESCLTVDGSREPILRNEDRGPVRALPRGVLVAGEAIPVGRRRRGFLGHRRQGSGREAEHDRPRNELQPGAPPREVAQTNEGRSAGADRPASRDLLAARVILQPCRVHFGGLVLLLLLEKPFAPLVV